MRDYLILGPLEVHRDGQPVDLGSPKQRAVLGALLAARGAVVSTDRLIDVVWGQSPPAAAMTSLQAYISNLRRALRDNSGDRSPLERVNPGYRLVLGRDRLDVIEFDRLARDARDAADERRWDDVASIGRRALDLWRGPLLAEIQDEKWVMVESAALAETRLGVAEAYVSALLAAGDTGRALRELTVLRSDEPLRDRIAWLTMVALHQAGRTPDALALFHDHAGSLADELGLDPSAELRELQNAILRHDPVIAAWPRTPHWSGAASVAVPGGDEATAAAEPEPQSTPESAGALVGRARQLEQIIATVADPARVGTRWIALAGPAGIGKTRLAQEAARIAADAGQQVIWVRCPDAEGIPAWWPLRQLCRDLGADPAEVLSVPDGVDADAARFAVYERVESLIAAAARQQPVTVIVDDVHWADAMSIGLLRYLTTVMRAAPVCVILTMRDEQIGMEATRTEATRLRAALARVDGRVIDVPRLTDDDVARLIIQTTGDDVAPDQLAMLVARTEGNPLFVTEYARLPERARHESVPAAVRSVLDRRLSSLDPAVLEVLGHAAVLGEEIDVSLLARVMDRDPDAVADCLDEAADDRIVLTAASHGRIMFAHALLREEAMRTVRPLRRCRIHLRVAETIAAAGGPDAIVRRAAHLLDALPVADPTDVIAACRAAADEATARWDSENAAYWLESALYTYESQPESEQIAAERDSLLIDMLGAHLRAGRAQFVLDTVESRLSDALRAEESATAGRLAGALLRVGGGWPWVAPGSGADSLHRVLEQAVEMVSADHAAAARVCAALAIGHCYHHDPSVPAGLLHLAADHAAHQDDPTLTDDVDLAHLITYSGVAGRAAETLDVADALRRRRSGDGSREAPGGSEAGGSGAAGSEAGGSGAVTLDGVIVDSIVTMATMALGDLEATERHLRRGIDGSERMRLPILRAQLRWMEAAVAVWRGEFDRAREHFRTALAVHQQTELYVAGSGALAIMAMASSQGVFDDFVDEVLGIDGTDRLRWSRDAVQAAPGNIVVSLLAAGVANVAGAAGDPDLARGMVETWRADPGPMIWTSLAQATILAEVVVDLGFVDAAQEFIDYLEPFAGCIATVGQVGCVGPVDLALTGLYGLVGDRMRADEALGRARELSERAGSPPNIVKCRLAAAVLTAPGAARDAELHDIERNAHRLGLTATADQARRARA